MQQLISVLHTDMISQVNTLSFPPGTGEPRTIGHICDMKAPFTKETHTHICLREVHCASVCVGEAETNKLLHALLCTKFALAV